MEYLLSHKKEWNNACSNMDGSRDYHTKWSQSQRDKYHVLSLMWNLKKQMNLFTKQIYRYWIENKQNGYRWGGGVSSSIMSNSATPWTVACQAPLPKGFPRQEEWIGLPFPSPGGFPDPGIEPRPPALQADSLPLSHQESPRMEWTLINTISFCFFLCQDGLHLADLME